MREICFVLLLSLIYGHIDPLSITLSGFSSGAFFATQYQFAYSASVSGVAIFAGGPYYCAQTQGTNAFLSCMYAINPVDMPALENYARRASEAADIDPLLNLQNHRVFMFSGIQDATVKSTVVRSLESMYRTFGVVNIESNFNLIAAHTFPTINYGNTCTFSFTPYISKCEYDGSGEALNTLYDNLKEPVPFIEDNLVGLDQSAFTEGRSTAALSLGPEAYLYIPTACKNPETVCKLHVVFHGCQQYKNAIGMQFVLGTGFNDWAEANDIFVLYPQAAASTSNPINPNGCWDWWGYLGPNFAIKSGFQMKTIFNMIEHVIATY